MFTLDPYGSDTLNTSAATYDCWECPEAPWCQGQSTLPPPTA
ncbi:MAG TPA: hypothetical protein VF092_20950 [Longimicrobium sp.]